jgi:prolyl-tRNA synthetase
MGFKFDDDDKFKPGYKFAEYELKGVPVRIAIGPRDLESGTVEIARRDTKEKHTAALNGIVEHIQHLLEDIQHNIYQKALQFRANNTLRADDWETFTRMLDETPGFIEAHWDGTAETEEAIKNATKATIRCIPLDAKEEQGKCIFSGYEWNGYISLYSLCFIELCGLSSLTTLFTRFKFFFN